MQYQHLLITIVFIILMIVARWVTRVKHVTYGTISNMTTVRERFAHYGAGQPVLRAPGHSQYVDAVINTSPTPVVVKAQPRAT